MSSLLTNLPGCPLQFTPTCGNQSPLVPGTVFDCTALGLNYNVSNADVPASFPLDFELCCVSGWRLLVCSQGPVLVLEHSALGHQQGIRKDS